MGVQAVDRHWYISRHGKRYGPYTFAALTEAAAKGVITADTNVWRLGWVSWHPASQVPGLIAEPAEAEEFSDGDSIVPAQERPGGGEEAAAGLSDRRQEHGVAPSRSDDVAADDDGLARAVPEDQREHALEDVPQDARQYESEDSRRDVPQDARQDGDQDAHQDTHPDAHRDALDGQPDAQLDPSQNAFPDAIVDTPPPPERPPDREITTAALRAVREEAPEHAERIGDIGVPVVPPQIRDGLSEQAPVSRPPRARRRGRKAAFVAFVLMLLAAAIWWLLASGTVIVEVPRWQYRSAAAMPLSDVGRRTPPLSRGEDGLSRAPAAANLSSGVRPPSSAAETADSALPAAVAALPAVAALRRTAPAAFAKFKERFGEGAANAADDQILALARTALRRSVKRQLANASGETMAEITEAYLGYMRALQVSDPQSCVALSDETKGASLTVNIEKEYPVLFTREMAALERIAGIDPATVVAPPTADEARPSLETVFAALRSQPVQSDLLGRTQLAPAEFLPYCSLVIAFYEDVLALPAEQRIDLLRYLYAAAAADSDDYAQAK